MPIAFLGARMFEQLPVDFECSLVDYLKGIDAARVSAQTTFSGIALRVDLMWRTPAGE